jgi:hypothetical protein
MGVRLLDYCGPCEPCSQGCCCHGMFSGCVSMRQCIPPPNVIGDCEPVNCYWIEGIGVGWAAPSACLESRAAGHGGVKQYEFYLFGCPASEGEPPDRVADGEEITGAVECPMSGVSFTREELVGCEAAEECSVQVNTVQVCVIVRGMDDEEITRCIVCFTGEDEPRTCDDSSGSGSGSSASDSSGSGSSSDVPVEAAPTEAAVRIALVRRIRRAAARALRGIPAAIPRASLRASALIQAPSLCLIASLSSICPGGPTVWNGSARI